MIFLMFVTGEHNLRFQRLPATRQERLKILKRMELMSEREEAVALHLTSDFHTTRPFFKVIMQPYYDQQMNLPVNFAMDYLEFDPDDKVVLEVSYGDGMNRRTWDVGYKSWDVDYKLEMNNGVPSPTFQAGWAAFAQDNNLKVGDVCVFVLLREMYTAFHVLIFRVSREFFKSLGKQGLYVLHYTLFFPLFSHFTFLWCKFGLSTRLSQFVGEIGYKTELNPVGTIYVRNSKKTLQ
ncbi:B3 domain-containing protein Os11g0197600-like [Humulus lupulus]|uniref:B3 domain-containing protein Os11g0197600-like n=1 Tax=Humulus lupulus TaxID=3486 RepID=UPI002B407F24|nr:B3 domain-containing protein Os11g0197600-like [Humulus lupulus]